MEKTLESLSDFKEIQPVHSKGNKPWIFIGRTDAEAGAPILWLPDAKSQVIGKDADAGKIEGWRKRGRQKMRWLDGITSFLLSSYINLWTLVVNSQGTFAFPY